jgi:hypothetical protein
VRYIIQIALLRNTESRALSLISALELLPKFLAKFVSQKMLRPESCKDGRRNEKEMEIISDVREYLLHKLSLQNSTMYAKRGIQCYVSKIESKEKYAIDAT